MPRPRTQWRKVADQLSAPSCRSLPAFLDEAETDVLAMIPPSAFRLSPADRPGSCR
jgi:hypothetical protein